MKSLFFLTLTILASCTNVEPGYVGIKVNSYGTQKGVEDFPIQTGRVTYNPITETIYKFPTFQQNVIWDKDSDSGISDSDESITFNSIEGSVINADVGVSYSIEASKIPNVFVKFRQDISHITHVFVRSEVRDAISRHASKYKVIDIFGPGKENLLKEVKDDVQNSLGPVGFKFEMISFVGALRADKNVMTSINATIEATQLAISAQNKVLQSKAEADQAIEEARGKAESLLKIARAQAEANTIISQSITPALVQYKALEKWDGVQPRFMSGSNGMVPLIQIDSK